MHIKTYKVEVKFLNLVPATSGLHDQIKLKWIFMVLNLVKKVVLDLQASRLTTQIEMNL